MVVPMVDVDTTGGEIGHMARLLLACKTGQLQVVLSLLDSGQARPDGEGWVPLSSVDIEGNSGDWHYWRKRECDREPTPLHEAAGRGHVEIVRALLAAGARKNPRAALVKTPLHLAAQQGQAEVIHVLAEAGANVNILGGDLAETPLHLATRYGHTAAMLALLHKGADINAGNCRNRKALHEARTAPALELLLASGADKNGQATHCASPLRLPDTPLGALVGTTDVRLASESRVEDVTKLVEVLLRHGANASIPLAACPKGLFVDSFEFQEATSPNSSPGQGLCSVVSPAASESDWSLETSGASESLSEADIAENRCSPSSEESTESFRSSNSAWVGPPSSPKSLLPRAAINGVPGIVAALLRTGLDPTEQDEHRMTPLHYAAEEGHPEVLRLLLRAGAEVDSATPTERRTPLHVACRCAHLDCVLELLRWGADLNALCVLSEDDFGLESGDDNFYFYRTPLQVVGWADSSTCTSQRENERDEMEERHNAVRRTLQREHRWRSRGGVVVLRCLLKKNKPREDAPTPENASTTAPSRSYSSDDARIIPVGASCLDTGAGGALRCNQDAKRVCHTTPGSDTEESFSGEESGRRQRNVIVSAMVEDQDASREADDKTMHALAGLMRLGWIKESLFRKVVRYL